MVIMLRYLIIHDILTLAALDKVLLSPKNYIPLLKKEIKEKNNFNKFTNEVKFGGDCFQSYFTSSKSMIIWNISYLYPTANRHTGKQKICLSSIHTRKDWAWFIEPGSQPGHFWILAAIHPLYLYLCSLFTLESQKHTRILWQEPYTEIHATVASYLQHSQLTSLRLT